MARKPRKGPLIFKKQRQLIAMAASGATVAEIAVKFARSAKYIEKKAMTLGVRLKGRGVESA